MRPLLALLFVACASGGEDSAPPTGAVDAARDSRETSSDCIFGCDPPAAKCVDDCGEHFFVAAGCDAGQCVFTEKTLDCPLGCNKTTGRCDTARSTACATVDCGSKNACGGTCTSTTGCCTSTRYDKTTGLAPSGSRACCDAGDMLVGTTDCGTGINHGVNKDGTCAVSWEGEMNGGTPCATAHCLKRVCS